VSTPATTSLHGVQLWVALPTAHRAVAPFFEHHAPPVLRREGVELRVFVGSLAGAYTDASVFSPLVGAQIDLAPGATLDLELDPSFEHGVLVDQGPVRVNDTDVAPAELAYLAPASGPLTLAADAVPARVILLGGEPLGEEIVMWWNFIGGSHDDIVAFRSEWQADVIDGGDPHGRFGSIPDYDGSALSAPVLPTVRLKPRG
jgi:redox-sensitive bicupin YhaK (pirin superfamily)